MFLHCKPSLLLFLLLTSYQAANNQAAQPHPMPWKYHQLEQQAEKKEDINQGASVDHAIPAKMLKEDPFKNCMVLKNPLVFITGCAQYYSTQDERYKKLPQKEKRRHKIEGIKEDMYKLSTLFREAYGYTVRSNYHYAAHNNKKKPTGKIEKKHFQQSMQRIKERSDPYDGLFLHFWGMAAKSISSFTNMKKSRLRRLKKRSARPSPTNPRSFC